MPHHHQTSAVNPEQVTSAINAAFAEFISVGPTHQENVDLIPLTTDNSQPSTQSHSDIIFSFLFFI